MRLFFVITCHSVFYVWPKTALLPVWPRGAKRLDTPVKVAKLVHVFVKCSLINMALDKDWLEDVFSGLDIYPKELVKGKIYTYLILTSLVL